MMGELPPEDGRNLYEALEVETLTTRFHCFWVAGSTEGRADISLSFLRKRDAVGLFSLWVSLHLHRLSLCPFTVLI